MSEFVVKELSNYHGNCNYDGCSKHARWTIAERHRLGVTIRTMSCTNHLDWFLEEFKRREFATVHS